VLRALALTKTYGRPGDGRALALDGASFEVGAGEVVGLLGPNGAGKTTLMRLLTCFLSPTRGTAWIGGCSIADDPRGARRAVGYLPEAVPLPPEMRVSEYLAFRAALKGIGRRSRAGALDAAIERAGLGDRRRQIIGTLSRGYRQRVGLADALLGRPPILILDEPMVGLDPNQIRETRALIRELGRERTVLLSTHVLSDVEAVATRVIILHRGRVVAEQATDASAARAPGSRRLIVEVKAQDRAGAEAAFRGAPGLAEVVALDETHLALTPTAAAAGHDGDGGEAREAVFRLAVAAGLSLRELRAEEPSLEEIFSRATGTGDTPA
jgi:ABC-2 type transport system ATP-binding protein